MIKWTLEDKVIPLPEHNRTNVTEQDINEAEDLLGKKLPKGYLNFIKKYNGCLFSCLSYFYLYKNHKLNMKNSEVFEEYIHVTRIFSLENTMSSLKNYDGYTDIENFPIKDMLVIGDTILDNPILLSLRSEDYGYVYYLTDQWEYSESYLLFLVDDFSLFIKNLDKENGITDFELLLKKGEYNKIIKEIKIGNIDINQRCPLLHQIYPIPLDTTILYQVSINSENKNTWKLIQFLLDNDIDVSNYMLPQSINSRKVMIEQFGFSIDKVNNENKTRLMYDCIEGSHRGIEFCLDYGANPNLKDIYNKTALDYLLEKYQTIDNKQKHEYEISIKLIKREMKKNKKSQ